MANSEKLIPIPDSACNIPAGAVPSGNTVDRKIQFLIILKFPEAGNSSGSESPSSSKPWYEKLFQELGSKIKGLFSLNEEPDPLKNFLNQNGLTLEKVLVENIVYEVSGPVEKVGKAFHVTIQSYQTENGSYRGYEGSLSAPENLVAMIQAVSGIEKVIPPVTIERSSLRPSKEKSAGKSTSSSAEEAGESGETGMVTHTLVELMEYYNFPKELKGKGQTIGIISLEGGYLQSDLDTYFQSLNMETPVVHQVLINNASGKPNPLDEGANMEITVDICVVGTVAPEAKIVAFQSRFPWFIPHVGPLSSLSDQAFTDAFVSTLYQAVFNQEYRCDVITMSWGSPELDWSQGSVKALNLLFEYATQKMGMSFFASAGDHGAIGMYEKPEKVKVAFPSTSPWVTACGGTQLYNKGSQIVAETVWNEKDVEFNGKTSSFATGGGVSILIPIPDFQNNVGVPANPDVPNSSPNSMRGVPDVACNAAISSGFTFYFKGEASPGCGTSVATPFWASLAAIANQSLGKNIGFFNEALYAVANQSVTQQITEGNNQCGSYDHYFSAGPGWNACTGWGSPNASQLISALKKYFAEKKTS